MTASIAFIVGFILFAILAFVLHGYVAENTGMDRENKIEDRLFMGLIFTIVLVAMIALTIYTLG